MLTTAAPLFQTVNPTWFTAYPPTKKSNHAFVDIFRQQFCSITTILDYLFGLIVIHRLSSEINY